MVTSPTSSSDHTSDIAAPRSRRSRVSAEHTLNRVRENQRRHRARQRDHVASLEQKLAETEKLLDEARAEIAALKGQTAVTASFQQLPTFNDNNQTKEAAQGGRICVEEGITSPCTTQDIPTAGSMPSSQPSSSSLGLAVQPASLMDPRLAYPDVPNLSDLSFLGDGSFYLPSSSTTSLLPSSLAHIQDLAVLSSPSINNSTTPTGPPPCCADPPIPTQTSCPSSLPSSSSLCPSPPTTTNNLECVSCKSRPLPSPSESTTLCAQAFVMIGQQNFRNLDPDTIRLWLAQGLRRARREGEGCRVENGALLRLLDFISGL